MKIKHFLSVVTFTCLAFVAQLNGSNVYAADYADCSFNKDSVPGVVTGDQIVCTGGGTGVRAKEDTSVNNVVVTVQSGVTLGTNLATIGLGSFSTVTNSGTLITSARFGYGISAGANSRSKLGGNTIKNLASGSITTSGSDSTGIYVWVDKNATTLNTITNDGSIQTTGARAYGIRLRSDDPNSAIDDTITNTGTITTSGAASHGVLIEHPSNIVSLTNSGEIVVKGEAADAINVVGELSLTNSGKICVGQIVGGTCTALATATGNGIQLIASPTNSNRSTITNQAAGSIVTTASGYNAINSSLTTGVDIYNYGTISSPGTAILLSAGSNTLTLYGGSSISGGISMNAAGNAETLTFSGYTNSNVSNAISGVNVLKSLGGSNVTMTGSGPIDFGAGTIEVDNASLLQINSTVSDRTSPATLATSINKTGTGTLNLTGANTYTGGTQLTAGTIGVGSNTALGTGSLTMSDATTLQALAGLSLTNGVTLSGGTSTINTNGQAVSMSGVVGGSGALQKAGSGMLTLTGVNTYSGGTQIMGGTLALNNNSAMGSGALTMSDATTLQALAGLSLNNAVTLSGGTANIDTNGQTAGMSGVISGTGILSKIGSGSLNLSGANTYTGGTQLTAGTIGVGSNTALGTGSLTMSNNTTLQALSSVTLANGVTINGTSTFDTNGQTLGMSGVISGTGILSKIASGSLNLTGANTYTGGTQLTAGTIGVGSNTALGTGSLTMSNNTALQALSGVTLANGVTINGTSTFDTNGQTLGMSGVIGGTGVLSKIGGGALNLTGANTYTGGTQLTAGTIGVGSNTALGTGSLTMSDSTTLQALSGVTLANGVTINGTSTFDTQGFTLGMSGVIGGSGSLTKISQGTLILNAANTYTGNTLIQAGTLILNGSITSNTTLSSGTSLQGGGTIFGSLTSSGNVAPSVAGIQTNLTIAGSYSSQGGTFTSNFYPGATQAQADTLTIAGASSLASGQTQVVFNNINNLGQVTTGDGILVVQTTGGAQTAPNAFSYPGRLAQGSYEYRLVRGGSTAADNWYVRADNSASVDFVSPAVADSIEVAQQSGESITPQPTERYEVANYPALKSLGRMYSMSIVDNLDLRRGDLLQLTRGGTESGRGIAWGRMIATGNQLRSSNRNDGPGLDGKAYAAQLGADLYRKYSSEGTLTVAGPFVTFGQTSGKTFNSNGDVFTGNTLMQGYSFGLNATHFAATGIYVDGVLQGTRFVGARANSIMGTSINTTGWGLAASLETGWKLNVSQRFSVTPQAQVWVVSNKFSDTGDTFSRIGMPTDTSTVGRVGVKLSYDTSDGKGPDTSAWLRVSGLSTMSGRNMQTVFQNTQGQFGQGYNGQSPNSWMTVDAGLNVKTGKNSQIYLNIGYDTSLSNRYQGVYGRAGVQFAF